MFAKPLGDDLATLWGEVDDATGGALYALRYECETNGWTPNLWAQTPEEGGPLGLTRLMFIGCDSVGRTVYFDTSLIRDTMDLAVKIKVSEITRAAARASRRIREGLERIDRGLDPHPYTGGAAGLN